MQMILVALVLVGAEPLPVPTAADLTRAQVDVQEVFGADLAAARKPADKAALARRMIDTATGSDPAERYALLTRARELAVAARDSATGIRAVEGLVAGFAPEKPQDAAQWAADGHRLWNEAGGKRSPGTVRGRLEAAECYLRCLDKLKGFQRAAVEKRLRELGWRVSPIDFNFDESVEGWKAENHIVGLKIEGGCLVGKITGGDPYLMRTGLAINANHCPVLYIRMALHSAAPGQFLWLTKNSPRWDGIRPKILQWPIQGGGQAEIYRLDLSKHPEWTGQTITTLRIDPGERDHNKPHSGEFSIDYVRGAKR